MTLKPMSEAPKTGDDLITIPFLAWCLDQDAPNGGDWRIIWWEPIHLGGCWWSDRDLEETPIGWTDLPPVPQSK